MAYPEVEWPSQQNISVFVFFLFHCFLVRLVGTISAQPSAEVFNSGLRVCVQGR